MAAPPGWIVHTDEHGESYYENSLSGECSWTPPIVGAGALSDVVEGVNVLSSRSLDPQPAPTLPTIVNPMLAALAGGGTGMWGSPRQSQQMQQPTKAIASSFPSTVDSSGYEPARGMPNALITYALFVQEGDLTRLTPLLFCGRTFTERRTVLIILGVCVMVAVVMLAIGASCAASGNPCGESKLTGYILLGIGAAALYRAFSTRVGDPGKAWNRLAHWKKDIFPLLDGPVAVLDIASMSGQDNTFDVLTNADAEPASKGASLETRRNRPRVVAQVAGVVRRGVLYQLLPKEQLYVPASEWATEYERSEIAEMVRALQLLGAVAIEFTHRVASSQPRTPNPPPVKNDPTKAATQKAALILSTITGIFRSLGASFARIIPKLTPTSRAALLSASPLSGTVTFRVNVRPATTLKEFLAGLGDYFFHLKRQPLMLQRVGLRLSRGALVADEFSITHTTPTSTSLSGMRKLQEENLPAGVPVTEHDLIDAGYSATRRPRYETYFRVLYPDILDVKRDFFGNEVEDTSLHVPGKLHHLSSVNDFSALEGFVEQKPQKGVGSAQKQKVSNPVELKPDAVAAEKLLALKVRLNEAATEAYLKNSMLEFVLAMKGLPSRPPDVIVRTVHDIGGSSSTSSVSGSGSGTPSSGGGGEGGANLGLMGRVSSLLGALFKKRGGGGSGGGGSSSTHSLEVVDDERGIPAPVSASRMPLGRGASVSANTVT